MVTKKPKLPQAAIWQARLHYGSPAFGYTAALALVLLAGTGRMALMENGDFRAPFVFFYPAVALASFLGGVGPGLLALIAGGTFAIALFPSPPDFSTWIAFSILGPLVALGLSFLREVREVSDATAREYARFRFISDNAGDWLFLVGESGAIEYANKTAAQQLGWEPAQLIGRRLEEFAATRHRSELREMLTRSRDGSAVTSEVSFARPDGSLIVMEAGCSAVQAADKMVVHVAARDITARKRMEDQLREAQRWESLGVMAGGLAHDFNNLLTAILGNSSLAREYIPESHPVTEPLDSIERAGERAAELIRLMLATAGYRSRRAETLCTESILEQALASREIPAHIRLLTVFETCHFSGDRDSMTTLLWSLVSNAAEAYGSEPGEVEVRVCAGTVPDLGPASFEEGVTSAGVCLGIIVEDRGCGMTSEVLSRAFDPFFSTKFTGRGLGLPAVRGIVRSHDGKIWLRTRPGEGTRVEIWLPGYLPSSTSSALASSS
ncbi:MAG: ATP-binding protein [Acidobacteriota bacterium]